MYGLRYIKIMALKHQSCISIYKTHFVSMEDCTMIYVIDDVCYLAYIIKNASMKALSNNINLLVFSND